ncbi:MAG: hypothetical protein LC114_17675 [Bryobacterales bacterium]|nr:hypothetical protein [Bryobacterales bacterium]
MAAIVAITLYMQLPRVAFEAQRDRETTLVERGEQYRRAIELYVRKNNRYPARIEDLERDQDRRYLRHRYKDPMTGKDEWRLIHINAAGQLEDSLVEKPKPVGKSDADEARAENAAEQTVAENVALTRRRPGDETAANSQFPGGGERGSSQPPESTPGSAMLADDDMVPLLDAQGNVIERTKTEAQAQAQQAGLAAGVSGAAPAGAQAPGVQPGAAQQQRAVRVGPGGIPIIENPVAALAAGSTTSAGSGTPQAATGSAANNAGGTPGQMTPQQLIERSLMEPRPGGLAGLQQQRGIQPAAGQAGFGAGIAGVASKLEMKGILVYDEQESIHKWEFVYDARKAGAKVAGDPTRSGARAGQPGGAPTFPGGFGSPPRNSNRSPQSSVPGGPAAPPFGPGGRDRTVSGGRR